MDIKLFDAVISTEDVDNIPRGSIGAVVEIWEDKNLFEIEFMDRNHKTLDCISLKPSQFKKLSGDEINGL